MNAKYPTPNPAQIRARREALGMTRQQLADATHIDLGIIERLETFYRHKVRKEMAEALCRVLQTDYASLLEGAIVPEERTNSSPIQLEIPEDHQMTPQEWRSALQEGARAIAEHPDNANVRSTVNTLAKLAIVSSRFMKSLTAEDEELGAKTQEELALKLKKTLVGVLEGLPEDVRRRIEGE